MFEMWILKTELEKARLKIELHKKQIVMKDSINKIRVQGDKKENY